MARATRDKIRIMNKVIQGLAITARYGPTAFGVDNPLAAPLGENWVHFEPWVKLGELKVGDLVVAAAVDNYDFALGFVDHVESHCCFLRETGSDSISEIHSDVFVLIRGIHYLDLLDRKHRIFYEHLMYAFAYSGETEYMFDRLEFDGDRAVVWVKEPLSSQINRKTKPFSICMPIVIDSYAIEHHLRLGGYGSREFEAEL